MEQKLIECPACHNYINTTGNLKESGFIYCYNCKGFVNEWKSVPSQVKVVLQIHHITKM